MKKEEFQRKRVTIKLGESIGKVKKLSGLLQICSSCKKTLAFIITLGILMFFGMPNSSKAREVTPQDSFLWIEYGAVIKEKDGSVTQRFFIRMEGGAPDKPYSPPILDLKAFY